ncbi:hypothetical protein ES332_A01G050600v1 [Gossypium tomentosum]|uniref:alpha-1,2-Mannosidase n=1 Tax=Gossypium tomentosum TaxID=34277 RepID=A0A5D2RN30_GOSTO|nr:hypothetical protein ES332_A01G050600v1 [Gossypium tomentosum]
MEVQSRTFTLCLVRRITQSITPRLRAYYITPLFRRLVRCNRVVGGLLSTYDLSGDNIFLEKARDIADRLLPAWDTPSGIPYNIINLARGNAHNPGWTGGDSILADSGTEELEFIALSQRTGDPKYQEKVEKAIVALNKTFPADGLVPIYVNPNDGTAYGTITFGAMGDSFYEYLLKAWIQGNKTSSVKPYR